MRRRMTRTMPLLAMALLAAFLVSGCWLFDLFGGVSITTRISDFEDELNKADRSQAYLQFHPTQTADYNAIKAAAFWDIPFPVVGVAGAAYAITVTTSSPTATPLDVRATVTGPTAFGGPKSARFVMAQDGSDWMIVDILFLDDDGVTWTSIFPT